MKPLQKAVPVNFAQFLKQTGTLNPDQLANLPKQFNVKIADTNIPALSHLTKPQLKSLSKAYQELVQTTLDEIDTAAIKHFPESLAREYYALLFCTQDQKLHIAMANPLDRKAKQAIRLQYTQPIHFYLAKQDVLQRLIEQFYRKINQTNQQASEIVRISENRLIKQLNPVDIAHEGHNGNVSTLLNTIIEDALNMESSDIHIEADRQGILVRYRINGTLIKQVTLPVALKDILLRHVLARSGGNITETRLPQDSSFQVLYQNNMINLRVSVIFSTEGYSIVMRLLMTVESYMDIDKILLDKKMLKDVKHFLDNSNGMVLITGPTSSGKTTLLYNALMYLRQTERKILTAEDPVEVQLPGITQVQVFPEIGLDYASVIRTSLRQNPDVLMIGEIRDSKSAAMATRAAITGVMVAATLHTKNVTSTILRLADLNVDLSMIATAVRMVIAARLIRMLCDNCKTLQNIAEEDIAPLSDYITMEELDDLTLYQANGCHDCQETGYHGQHGVYEYIELQGEMISHLANKDLDQFRTSCMKQLKGSRLGDNAIKLWKMGITSLPEVKKLVFN